jgi:hypothetical protein
LGDVPIGYELMRSNPKEFYKSKITLDNTTLMRWIWKGLHDAAELSIANSVPVFAAEWHYLPNRIAIELMDDTLGAYPPLIKSLAAPRRPSYCRSEI